ncbi:periplasmic heavy metal sensor [Denitromonas halophila]|uniref:Periplasmic heavy metal sensor n=2 Tax=Denitromonas halophila TaxID=1629404 RepID=A0A557QXR0_9RHOO|nr:periplasmic heavy metal sensor [Denitromonas halophila]
MAPMIRRLKGLASGFTPLYLSLRRVNRALRRAARHCSCRWRALRPGPDRRRNKESMMNKRKSIIGAFLLASSIALAVPLAAQAAPGMGGGKGGCEAFMHMGPGMDGPGRGGMMRMLKGLDLTEAQRDQIFELKHAEMPKMREQMKLMRDLKNQLREAAIAENYDAARVKALTEQQSVAMATMMQSRIAGERAVYEVLTPEQRKQLQEKRAWRGDKREGMGRGKMRGGPSPDA